VDTREKSLKLAELMGWKAYYATYETDSMVWDGSPEFDCTQYVLEPYEKSQEGLAQFAAIFLKHPDVMERFVCTDGHTDASTVPDERYARYGGDYQGYLTDERKPTQENILDEILRMNGETLD